MIPAIKRSPKIAASKGLPSTLRLAVAGFIPNHTETGLDPMIQSQMTGNQRLLETRWDLSRTR